MPRRATITAVTIAVIALLAGCSTGPVGAPQQPLRPSTPAPSGDGVLRIGTLLPTSGETAFLSPAQVAGVELAVREINEAGALAGVPVEIFHRDSGDASTQTAEASYAELLSQGVDLIVGPASSVLAERLLPLAIADGVALVSPSATSPSLSALDDEGLLLRTAPSAAMQGRALGLALAEEGEPSVVTVSFDEASSLAVTDELAEALGDSSVTLAETFTSETDVAALAARVAQAAPKAVVVSSPFSAEAPTAALLSALLQSGVPGSSLWLTSASLADYSQALPAGALEGARGVLDGRDPDAGFAARVRSMDPGVDDVRYAAEAYDAVMLAALAAVVAGDDGGRSLAYAAIDVSGSGIKCTSFAECIDVLETQPDIDYDGASGPLSLDARGDPRLAHYRVFTYGVDNRAAVTSGVLVE